MLSLYKFSKEDVKLIIDSYREAYGLGVLPKTYERLENTVKKRLKNIIDMEIYADTYQEIESNIKIKYSALLSIKSKIEAGEELNTEENFLINSTPTDIYVTLATYDAFKNYVDTALTEYSIIMKNNDEINLEVHDFIERHISEYTSPIFNSPEKYKNLVLKVGYSGKLNYLSGDIYSKEVMFRVMELEMFLFNKNGRILFIDTETTDLLRAGKDCLPIQLTYIITDTTKDLNIIDKGNIYILQNKISSGAVAIHGMDRDVLLKINASLPEDVYKEIYGVIMDSRNLFVAHNAAFDSKVIANYGYQVGKNIYPQVKYCTYQGARRNEIQKEKYDKISKKKGTEKLGSLCEFNNISKEDISEMCMELFMTDADYHNSIYDTVALLLLFKKNYSNILDN